MIAVNKFTAPSEFDIAQAEAKLATLRKSREEAKKRLDDQFQEIVENITDKLQFDDAVQLYEMIEKRLMEGSTGHRKVRGHPVGDALKKQLDEALKENKYTLEQLENKFGVSISFIAKRKKDLGLTRPRVGGEGVQISA